ncbi:MAG: hypothetical protein ACR2Q4_10525 [Geminicoccaceae bacterium]
MHCCRALDFFDAEEQCMSPSFMPVEPFDRIVFGGTGDLARRNLLPALFHQDCDDQWTDHSPSLATGARRPEDIV